MLRAGHFAGVLREAGRLWDDPKLTAEDRAWVCIKAFEAAWQRDRKKAIFWADRGLTLTPVSGEARGWLHFQAGTASIYTDLHRAEQEFTFFHKRLAAEPALHRLEGDMLYNLAYVHRAYERLNEQVRYFQQAARVYEAGGCLPRVAACWFETAWSYLLFKQTDQAEPWLTAAEESVTDHGGDPDLHLDIQLANALYRRLHGEDSLADQICLALLREDLPLRLQADVKWILGENALDRQEIIAAERWAGEAHAAAIKDCWWPAQLNRIEALQKRLSALTDSAR